MRTKDKTRTKQDYRYL